jgi:hypothetical protein
MEKAFLRLGDFPLVKPHDRVADFARVSGVKDGFGGLVAVQLQNHSERGPFPIIFIIKLRIKAKLDIRRFIGSFGDFEIGNSLPEKPAILKFREMIEGARETVFSTI